MGSIFQSKAIILVSCEACGSVHAVEFTDLKSLQAQLCKVELAPVFRTRRASVKVYREFQRDILENAIAV